MEVVHPPFFPIGFSQEKKDKSESRREERREEVTQALIGILSSDHCRSNASRTFLVPNVGFVQKKWVMCKKLLVQFEICDRPSACGIPNFATTLSAIIHPPLSLILSAPLGPNSGLCFSWLNHHFCWQKPTFLKGFRLHLVVFLSREELNLLLIIRAWPTLIAMIESTYTYTWLNSILLITHKAYNKRVNFTSTTKYWLFLLNRPVKVDLNFK